jgi:hypothetical protein
VADVVGADDDEVIHDPEHERTGHRRRDDPSAGDRTREGHPQTGERSGENDDPDEEIGHERRRDARLRMGGAVHDADDQVANDDSRKQALRRRVRSHTSLKTSEAVAV